MLHRRRNVTLPATALTVCLSAWGCTASEAPKKDAGTHPMDASTTSDTQAQADTTTLPDTQGPEIRPDAQADADARQGDGGPGGSGGGGGSDAREAGGSDATEAGMLAAACPPAPTACKVMPFGDSITDGAGSSGAGGGYRVPLFHKALMANQHLTFVGGSMNGPETVDGVTFPKQHEGHSGYTIDDGGGRAGISQYTMTTIATMKPDVITLMIGTNDIDIQLDVANAPMRLGGLLDKIYQNSPNTTVILAQIVPSQDDGLNQRVSTYNGAMPALVNARKAAGKRIILVDMYGAFTAVAGYKTGATALLSDRLHPNDAGYVKMADVWYAALGPLLH
jgi:lysophospholipase L1-like esterase